MNIGMVLLGLWLLFTGLISLFSLTFSGENIVLGILALAAGVLVLTGR